MGLLLYLVAHPKTTHSREELAYLLWDGDGKKERHSLSQALYDIRSNVGPIIKVDTNTVRLLPDQIEYEVDNLETAIREKDHATALELYRGEFAPDLLNLGAESFDRWLDDERERCRVLASLALKNAQRNAEEHGDWDEMCLAALRLIKLNEFDEDSHCALIRGLWLKGDPASAAAHYEAISDAQQVAASPTIGKLTSRAPAQPRWMSVSASSQSSIGLPGRRAPFRALVEELRSTTTGSRTVVVTGEVGVGKRRLVQAFVEYAGTVGSLTDWSMRSQRPFVPQRRSTAACQSRDVVVIDVGRA
ncbi:MAG: hypothetical protein MJB57_12575, partial [Gemmatimonadetes bacterium]|nr:hypothetical protein [Gemmatimonadota bacterium]